MSVVIKTRVTFLSSTFLSSGYLKTDDPFCVRTHLGMTSVVGVRCGFIMYFYINFTLENICSLYRDFFYIHPGAAAVSKTL